MKEWNINDNEGKKLLIDLIKELVKDKNIEIKILPYLIKKLSKKKKIIIKKNNKIRNINNYIKIKYGSIKNLLIEINHIFILYNDKIGISPNYKKESKEYIFI